LAGAELIKYDPILAGSTSLLVKIAFSKSVFAADESDMKLKKFKSNYSVRLFALSVTKRFYFVG
jgi:C4-dicarboxylate transporter